MLAQIAYAEGKPDMAGRLSSGISERDIESPIEGAYRLPFLQGRPPSVSPACFKFGCLTPAARSQAEIGAFAMALLTLGLAGLAWHVMRTMRRRLAAIADLTATERRRRATA
jgi:hypothetical protein